MVLQTVDVLSYAISLIAASLRMSKQLGAGGQVERLAVPMENRLRRRQSLVQAIARGGGGPLHGIPADLRGAVLVHASAEGFGDQLRSEADAENRRAARNGLANNLQLSPGIGEIVVGRHLPAHENERIGRTRS